MCVGYTDLSGATWASSLFSSQNVPGLSVLNVCSFSGVQPGGNSDRHDATNKTTIKQHDLVWIHTCISKLLLYRSN